MKICTDNSVTRSDLLYGAKLIRTVAITFSLLPTLSFVCLSNQIREIWTIIKYCLEAATIYTFRQFELAPELIMYFTKLYKLSIL